MKKQIPNVLSVTRGVLGLPLLILGVLGHYQVALLVYSVACATDFFDGLFAKMLHVESRFGKEVLDPTCDGIMTTGAIIGLLIQHDLRQTLINLGLASPILLIGLWLNVVKKRSTDIRHRLLADAILFVSYCATVFLLGFVYVHKAFNGDMDTIWWTTSAVAVPLIAYIKKHRIAAVWSGGNL